MADNSQQALQDIQAFDASRANPTDVLSQAQSKYGVDQTQKRLVGLRSAIMGTEGLLNAVDPSVTGRTSNSLVTEAQRSRMVANERAPIAEQYSQQQGALSNENANLSDLSARAAQEAQATLTGQDTKRSALQSLYDSLYKREQDALAEKRAEQNRQDTLAAQRNIDAQNSQYAALLAKYNSGGGGGGSSTAAAAGGGNLDAVKQSAYDDVMSRANQSPDAIRSDYNATMASARRGNQKDIYKVNVYQEKFGNIVNAPGKSSSTIDWNQAAKTGLSSIGNTLYKGLGIANAVPNVKGWLGMK